MAHEDSINDWISIRHLQHFLARGQATGLETPALLEALGLSRSRLDDSEATLPVAALEPVLAHLSKSYPGVPFGLQLARDVQPATFGVLGFLTQSAPRFSDILDSLVRYNGLLSNIGHFSLQPAPGQMEVHWDCRTGGPLFQRHAREYVLGSLVQLGRSLLPPGTRFPLAIHFPHPEPEDRKVRDQYHSLFQCPVHFEHTAAAVIIDSRLLTLPMRHGDPTLYQALTPHAEQQLRQRHQQRSLADEVARLVGAMLGEHEPTVAEVARQLGLSERTLHRRLNKEGTRFHTVLDQVRLDRARSLLRESNASLEALAARLGLQSRQSLIRWFRQRTGVTPGQFRETSTTRADHERSRSD